MKDKMPFEKWFEQHIPTACSLLAEVIAGTDYEAAIAPVLEVAKNHQPEQD